MIKLKYITTGKFYLRFFFYQYGLQLIFILLFSIVPVLSLLDNIRDSDTISAIIDSFVLGFVSFALIIICISSVAQRSNQKQIISELFTLNQESFTMTTIYPYGESTQMRKLTSIRKVIWFEDGFVIKSGRMFFLAQNGTFETGSMKEIYMIFKNIPTIKMIRK